MVVRNDMSPRYLQPYAVEFCHTPRAVAAQQTAEEVKVPVKGNVLLGLRLRGLKPAAQRPVHLVQLVQHLCRSSYWFAVTAVLSIRHCRCYLLVYRAHTHTSQFVPVLGSRCRCKPRRCIAQHELT